MDLDVINEMSKILIYRLIFPLQSFSVKCRTCYFTITGDTMAFNKYFSAVYFKGSQIRKKNNFMASMWYLDFLFHLYYVNSAFIRSPLLCELTALTNVPDPPVSMELKTSAGSTLYCYGMIARQDFISISYNKKFNTLRRLENQFVEEVL